MNLIADFPAGKYRDIQYLSRDQQDAITLELLREHIAYAAKNSPFYQRLGIDSNNIRDFSDMQLIPTTEKRHLTEQNLDFLAVPRETVTDVCMTSATVGSQPTMILQTPSDLARLAHNEEIAFGISGLGSNDILAIGAAIDRCFMAGLAYYLGAQRMGATAVRIGAGSAAQHWELIKTTDATAIVGVPSMMLKIAQYAQEAGDDPASSTVRKLLAIGEPTRDAGLELLPLGKLLEETWQAPLYSTYASTEMATSFNECDARCGGHLRPELAYMEILDDDGKPVPQGETGEVTLTPLGVKGMPLIRFRTGDIAYMIDEPCSCGRTSRRISPVVGRKNQMLKYKGTLMFPNAVMSAVEGLDGFLEGYVTAKCDSHGNDLVTLCAAIDPARLSLETMRQRLQSKIRVVPQIELMTEDAIREKVYLPGKRKRVIFHDYRSNNE